MGQGIPDWLVASTGLSSQHNMTVWKYLQVRAAHADTPVHQYCFKVHGEKRGGLDGARLQGISDSMGQGIPE